MDAFCLIYHAVIYLMWYNVLYMQQRCTWMGIIGDISSKERQYEWQGR